MNYEVNENFQKSLLAEIIAKRKASIKFPLLVMKIMYGVSWLCFFIPLLLMIEPVLECISNGWYTDLMAWVIMVFIVAGGALIVSIIPRCIQSVVYRKYLMPWYGKSEESIVVTDKYVEYNYYNLFWGERFWSNKMRFNQIVQMEYDDKQKLLRVYGPIETREWIDSGKNQCWDKTAADPETGMDDWMEIPCYFQNFDKLMKELEEKVGKPVLKKEREFIIYK